MGWHGVEYKEQLLFGEEGTWMSQQGNSLWAGFFLLNMTFGLILVPSARQDSTMVKVVFFMFHSYDAGGY